MRFSHLLVACTGMLVQASRCLKLRQFLLDCTSQFSSIEEIDIWPIAPACLPFRGRASISHHPPMCRLHLRVSLTRTHTHRHIDMIISAQKTFHKSVTDACKKRKQPAPRTISIENIQIKSIAFKQCDSQCQMFKHQQQQSSAVLPRRARELPQRR